MKGSSFGIISGTEDSKENYENRDCDATVIKYVINLSFSYSRAAAQIGPGSPHC